MNKNNNKINLVIYICKHLIIALYKAVHHDKANSHVI